MFWSHGISFISVQTFTDKRCFIFLILSALYFHGVTDYFVFQCTQAKPFKMLIVMKLLCFKSLSEVCRSASVAAAPPPPGGLGGFVFG